ncbi:MAG: hypothetical protein HN726_01820 [Candidatus Magasanikbacteria bacterium]|jgi:hypothetical protein|nr:hypothetical protein [Candidatus Magasanikbacteria bacterium]MBT4221250.1 hypothetical protein [Candidatus Magasanikbacteria bacterium]MBT4350396.1 hypothetical protein [Candidatus Magasanikbacteria bacterium]MBT4542057.1 hypothetical protein [Candidatus Magasanikbacteria bacterium]MBT6253583.1 hypothetical protein [Candidatus Magasanikbacteria bacterium]
MKKHNKAAIIFLSPFVLLFIIFVLYAVINFATAASYSSIQSPQPIISEEPSSDLVFNEVTSTFDTFNVTPTVSDTSLRGTVSSIINIVLSFLGIIALLGIFVSIPLGIFVLIKEDKPKA